MPRRVWVFCLFGWFLASLIGFAAEDAIARHLKAAGNASDEAVRLQHLRALANEPGLSAQLKAELSHLLPVVEAWSEGRARAIVELQEGKRETHRYLHHFFEEPTKPFNPPFPVPPAEASPLFPMWAFYRARFLAWFMIEDSGVSRVPERRKNFLGQSEAYFDLARREYPENPVLKIYGGENLPVPGLSSWDDRAPAWANHQRRALEQLHRIIVWWIDERQLPNGEFGGKWGDDIEMWRWWAAILLGFDDPKIHAAQELLARGNLNRPGMAQGYTNHLTDVEHTAEETADTLTPLMHLEPDEPEWRTRVLKLISLADAVWWGENARGQLQFKHIDFSATELGADPGRAYDTGYHVRVMQPALLLWQRTNDPVLGAKLTRWLKTWAEASLGSENGKPAGVVPPALQWPSGLVGSVERGWIGPHLEGDPMVNLYSWPAYSVAAMTLSLLQAHVQTGDSQFLEPLLKMAALRRTASPEIDREDLVGSPDWAAHRVPLVLNDALAKWRQLSGDRQFDDLLRADATGYKRFMLDQDKDRLTEDLGEMAKTLSFNWPMFTDEVRYTDRVLSFPHAWPRTTATGLRRIDANLLYSSVTGDPGTVLHYPINGARWHTLPIEIAALVARNERDEFAAELFHFGSEKRPLAVSLLVLDPGVYRWRLISSAGDRLAHGEVTLSPVHRRLDITLPSRLLVRLELERKP